jgi:hypothetical protein
MAKRNLILVELNEVNFEVAQRYVTERGLTNFAELFRGGVLRTSSESRYEMLEPWIQWVSAHTGMTADEHGVFRLGDMVNSGAAQIYEQLELQGVRVGAVSPMNTVNRLRNPAYFIPDPWTQTPSDGTFWSRILTRAVAQAVNDNAQGRLTFASAAALALGLIRFASPRHYGTYFRLALRSRGAPWRKALFLDLFLHDLHRKLLRRAAPEFSSIFLNAGAHIQHHYFFNSKAVTPETRNPAWYVDPSEDPIGDMLEVYDRILGDYLEVNDSDLIVATGLTQKPYDRVKFYYRLRDHAEFLRLIGVRFAAVVPRMTRDFLVEFASASDAAEGARKLAEVRVAGDGQPLFGEIDNRGASLFISLTYPNEITADVAVAGVDGNFPLLDHVAFVAIKNGMHDAHGFISYRGEVSQLAPETGAHVKHLYSIVLRFFGAHDALPQPSARDG